MYKNYSHKKTMPFSTAGFTLLEILLSVAIITILAGFTIPIEYRVLTRYQLSEGAAKITSALHTAQLRAKAGERGTAWGVSLATETVTIYSGESFAARNTTVDEIVDLPAGVGMTSTMSTDIHFQKISGAPTHDATITIANDTGTKTLYVNTQGGIIEQ